MPRSGSSDENKMKHLRRIQRKHGLPEGSGPVTPDQPVHGDTPAAPKVIGRSKARFLVPAAAGVAAVGGGTYMYRRHQRSKVNMSKREWMLPDGDLVVVVKADDTKERRWYHASRDSAGAGALGSLAQRGSPMTGAAGGALLMGPPAHGLGSRAGRRKGKGNTVQDSTTKGAVIGGGLTAMGGPGLARMTGGNKIATTVGAGAAGAAGWGTFARSHAKARHQKARQMDEMRAGRAALAKAYSGDYISQSSTSVAPRTPSGKHVGNANSLKRYHGKAPRPTRTQLVHIGRRGNGRGSKSALVVEKNYEGWNTFQGGQETTSALSWNR